VLRNLHYSHTLGYTTQQTRNTLVVYYESRKRELKKKRKNEDRCDERLKTKEEESTCLTCTGLHEELEHLKIKTRLINTKLVNVMGEYVI
jgi:hypothetical protein